jgi:hypothetical protein
MSERRERCAGVDPISADGLATAFLAGSPAERREELCALARDGLARQGICLPGDRW